jgi:hypothetical protein
MALVKTEHGMGHGHANALVVDALRTGSRPRFGTLAALVEGSGMSDTPGKPSLRYVVTAVCSFDFVNRATPQQEVEIPKLLQRALTEAVEGYTTRNTSATNVEFVTVTSI